MLNVIPALLAIRLVYFKLGSCTICTPDLGGRVPVDHVTKFLWKDVQHSSDLFGTTPQTAAGS
jgi:hypothetical protein